MRIGVIAEGTSDVEVLYELTSKLIDGGTFSFKKFVGHGCGKLRRKCTAWAENLIGRGCTHLVVLHDLDGNTEDKLRTELTDFVCGVGFNGFVILIPVREIEAWLLVDPVALYSVFGMSRAPNLPSKPEAIPHPKEKLRDIIWRSCKKYYVNKIHNKKIAAAIRVNKVKKLCRSFRPYPEFIKSHIVHIGSRQTTRRAGRQTARRVTPPSKTRGTGSGL
jgi:hypothetical protein